MVVAVPLCVVETVKEAVVREVLMVALLREAREAREAVDATLRVDSDACAKLCCSIEATEAMDCNVRH